MAPSSLWPEDSPILAGIEVLSAIIQFPDWPFSWFMSASAPILSGYQLEHRGRWSQVPHLHLDRTGRCLDVHKQSARRALIGRASPSLRLI